MGRHGVGYITKDSTVTIDIIAANLRNTIAGKEIAYSEWRRADNKVGDLVCKMLDINIRELRRILQDVEQYQAEAE